MGESPGRTAAGAPKDRTSVGAGLNFALYRGFACTQVLHTDREKISIMEWITEAANQRNKELHRRGEISRGAPTVWKNVCLAIDQAVKFYRKIVGSFPVTFSGCSNHVCFVAVFDEEEIGVRAGDDRHERERVTLTFNQDNAMIEAHFSRDDSTQVFPMAVDLNQRVYILQGKSEVSPDSLVEILLRDVFFPPL